MNEMSSWVSLKKSTPSDEMLSEQLASTISAAITDNPTLLFNLVNP